MELLLLRWETCYTSRARRYFFIIAALFGDIEKLLILIEYKNTQANRQKNIYTICINLKVQAQMNMSANLAVLFLQ